jgi:[ribosomal protein S18]-alanine N-acetyltransferase
MSVSSRIDYVPLAPEHISHLLAIENEAYPDPWKQGMFRQEISNATSFFCVALREEEIVGYGGFWLMLDEAHITKVTVAEPWRGQGLGHELMVYLLEEALRRGAASARLEVREHNQPARQLYEQLGFRAVGLRKGYYAKTNENAVVMAKSLHS